MKISNINKYLVILFLMLLSLNVFSQDITINEIMTANTIAIADEDGTFEDWIEVNNYGTVSVDLSGYRLSDEFDLLNGFLRV
ncbi:MAG: hypothetical protein ACJA1B_000842 [Polaribacter sp.]|jgi:hypothetical protein